MQSLPKTTSLVEVIRKQPSRNKLKFLLVRICHYPDCQNKYQDTQQHGDNFRRGQTRAWNKDHTVRSKQTHQMLSNQIYSCYCCMGGYVAYPCQRGLWHSLQLNWHHWSRKHWCSRHQSHWGSGGVPAGTLLMAPPCCTLSELASSTQNPKAHCRPLWEGCRRKKVSKIKLYTLKCAYFYSFRGSCFDSWTLLNSFALPRVQNNQFLIRYWFNCLKRPVLNALTFFRFPLSKLSSGSFLPKPNFFSQREGLNGFNNNYNNQEQK